MPPYKLNRNAFKAQTVEEAANHSTYYHTLSWIERLHVAAYFNNDTALLKILLESAAAKEFKDPEQSSMIDPQTQLLRAKTDKGSTAIDYAELKSNQGATAYLVFKMPVMDEAFLKLK